MFEVTLKDLRAADACVEGYNKLVCHLSGEQFDAAKETHIRFAHKEQISILTSLESNGLDDALWALRCVKGHDRDLRLYAVWCARQVEHLNTNACVKKCSDVAEQFANGLATQEEMDAASAAAWDAAWDAAGEAASARVASEDAQAEMLIKICNGDAPWQSNSITQ